MRDPVQEISTLSADAQWSPQELDTALLLIGSMTTDGEPERYHDTYRERLEDLIDQERAGTVVPAAPQATERAPVIDLLQALEASLRAARCSVPASTGEHAAAAGTAATGEPVKRSGATGLRKASSRL